MQNQLQSKQTKRQPLSLRWKWGLFLFAMITVLGTALITTYHFVSLDRIREDMKKEVQSQFSTVGDFLSRRALPFGTPEAEIEYTDTGIKRFNNQQTILGMLRHFEQNRYLIRIDSMTDFTTYQTESIDLITDKLLPEVRVGKLESQPTIYGYNLITSDDTGLDIGRLFLVLKPEIYRQRLLPQWRLFGILIIALLLIGGLVSYLLSNYMLRPLTYLVNALDLVEEESLSELRLHQPRSNDEWSDLSLHLNKLLDKIASYVTHQKQFVEDVSHELRTPVAIVEGHLQLLNRWGKDDPEILEESISASLQEIKRMKGLVQEMLDLSRADHVDVDYKDEITEIYSITQQVYNNFKIIHPDFNFYLDMDDSVDNELFVRMYRNHYEQVLIILLDNAVKYSRDQKEVHISINQSLNHVEIAVQDFGEGMSEDDKERVFSRFYRVDKARSREKGGNGLGLSIARQLVISYKGDIWADSVLGQGSIFYITLPYIKDPDQIKKVKAIKKSSNNDQKSA